MAQGIKYISEKDTEKVLRCKRLSLISRIDCVEVPAVSLDTVKEYEEGTLSKDILSEELDREFRKYLKDNEETLKEYSMIGHTECDLILGYMDEEGDLVIVSSIEE